MSERALSNEQFAEHVKEHGGGSIGFFNREPVTGKGFMTAISGSEDTNNGKEVSATDIGNFQKKNEEKASSLAEPVHGVWGTTQDISVQAKSPKAAETIGKPTGEEASYGLAKTRTSNRGHNMGKGGDVLLHTADLGKNDVDPRYRPGALDISEKEGSFTRNQYQNKDWDKVGGTNNGKKVTYGDVLKKINKNRAMRVREGK